MLSEKLDTIITELVEIMDRLEELPKSETITDREKIDINFGKRLCLSWVYQIKGNIGGIDYGFNDNC